MILSYQRLLEIVRKLPDDEARYVLCFILKNDKDHQERIEKIDKIQLDMHRKRVKAGDLVVKLKEHRRVFEESKGKGFYTKLDKLIEMLEKVYESPELAMDNTPHWRVLVDLMVKTKAIAQAICDSDKELEELLAAQIPYERAS